MSGATFRCCFAVLVLWGLPAFRSSVMRGDDVAAGCGLRAAGCGLRAAGCGLRATGYGLRATGCQVWTFRCGVPSAGCRVRVTGTGYVVLVLVLVLVLGCGVPGLVGFRVAHAGVTVGGIARAGAGLPVVRLSGCRVQDFGRWGVHSPPMRWIHRFAAPAVRGARGL